MPKLKLTERAFDRAASIIIRAPWLIVGGFSVLAVLSIAFTALRLQLKTDQNDLIAADLPYNQRYNAFLKEFGDLEFLYVVILVDGKPELAMKVADAVADEVSRLTDHVQEVLHRVPAESFGESALLLLPQKELGEISGAVTASAETVKRFDGVSSFASFLSVFADSFGPGLAIQNRDLARWGFTLVDLTLDSLLTAARGGSPRPLPERAKEMIAEQAPPDPRQKGYMFSANGKLAFVEIMPKKNFETLEIISEPLGEIRAALDRVRARFPGIEFGLTGRPVLAADEMRVTNRDMTVSSAGAFVLVLALFILVFRRLRRPLLAGLALVIGIFLTFGLVTMTIGYLTLLSIVFTAMLVGDGIDYGIHFLARYQEELAASHDVEGSIRATLVSTGRGIWMGGVTTAVAYFSTMFVSFKGLAELGFVAGSGLLVCMITMLTLLPALVVLSDRHIRRHRILHPPHLIQIPLLDRAARRPRTTLAVLVLLTAAGFWGFRGLPYNWNLLDLQARGLESVRYEREISKRSDRSTWFAAFIVDGLGEVDRTLAALEPARAAGIVGSTESIRDFVTVDQEEKLALLKPAHDLLAGIDLPAATGALAADELGAALEKLRDQIGRLRGLAALRGAEGEKEVEVLDGLLGRAGQIGEALAGREAVERLSAYQPRWFGELQTLRAKVARMLAPSRIQPETIHSKIRCRFLSDDGKKFLVYAYPRKDIWEEKNMEEFVAVIRQVDPEVTGTPIQVYESASRMHEGFLWAALYSFVVVALLILVDFRSWKPAALALVPLFIGLLWGLQIMPLVGLDFNLANFFALPILIGYGVSGGIHVMHRFRERRSIADVSAMTASAIGLSSLTTIVGFGALAFAHHRGVASLGQVTALGSAAVLVASVVFLPCLLEIHEQRRRRRQAQRRATQVQEDELIEVGESSSR